MVESDGALTEKICSFLRTGASAEDACLSAGLDKADVEKWLDDHTYWVDRAQAQFRVLACNCLMTEGGAAGAKYLLENFVPRNRANEEHKEPHEADALMNIDIMNY